MSSLTAQGLQGLIPMLAGLGTVVQILVLVALLVSSVVCWSIIVHKSRRLGRARRDNARFLQVFRTGNDLAFIAAGARRFTASPLARLFRVAHQHLEDASVHGRRPAEGELAPLSPQMLDRLRQLLHTRQAEEIERLGQGLSFLATTASATPFVGLFGTVWGIMQSFHAIGQGGGATLSVVGPGISEALIATAAGLAAAIPAVIAYNHYTHRLRRFEGEMDSFIEDLAYLFETYLPVETQRLSGRTSMPH